MSPAQAEVPLLLARTPPSGTTRPTSHIASPETTGWSSDPRAGGTQVGGDAAREARALPGHRQVGVAGMPELVGTVPAHLKAVRLLRDPEGDHEAGRGRRAGTPPTARAGCGPVPSRRSGRPARRRPHWPSRRAGSSRLGGATGCAGAGMGRRLVRCAGGRGLRPHALRGTAGKRCRAPGGARHAAPTSTASASASRCWTATRCPRSGRSTSGCWTSWCCWSWSGWSTSSCCSSWSAARGRRSTWVDGAVVVVGGPGCRPHRCAEGSLTVLVPQGALHEGGPDLGREGATGQLAEPAMFSIGSGLPLTSRYMPTEVASWGEPGEPDRLVLVGGAGLAGGRPAERLRRAAPVPPVTACGHGVDGVGWPRPRRTPRLVCLLDLVVAPSSGAVTFLTRYGVARSPWAAMVA